ncbi:monocarboxylate transporter 2-like [Poecilia reticulata]|uniref:monocarboxylate transporter 2-like n=1 Tax=Poecilia reticulata TaxID=8081 RepID=UPI0004A3EE70|nr:PREDICTED: monocarboxylate transporter 2-like [Poecilia reticulata]
MPPAAATNLGYTPPDGGWGWAVAFAAFISIGFSHAFPKSLTIYFKEIQEYFSVSYREIAWVSSVMLPSMYAGGPVCSMLVNRHGSRPEVMVGGYPFLTISLIKSQCFGLAFNLQSALTITGTYFQVKRPLANGLAMTGSPVVLSTLAPLNQFLLYSFGGRGSFSVLWSIVLNRCVAGALMRPVNKQARSQSNNVSSVSRRKTSEEAAAVDISSLSANPSAEDSKNKRKSQSFVSRYVDIRTPGPWLMFSRTMYYACGALMLVPSVFLFIMHYYNYKKLDEDCRQTVKVEIRTSEETVKLKINQNEKNKQ